MITMLHSGLGAIQGLIAVGITVAAAIYIAGVWWRTRALVPTLTAIALSAVVVWATANVDVLGDRINEDSELWIDGAPTITGSADPATRDGRVLA